MDVKHFCGLLDGLAFLPLGDVLEGLAYLRDNTPKGPCRSNCTSFALTGARISRQFGLFLRFGVCVCVCWSLYSMEITLNKLYVNIFVLNIYFYNYILLLQYSEHWEIICLYIYIYIYTSCEGFVMSWWGGGVS